MAYLREGWVNRSRGRKMECGGRKMKGKELLSPAPMLVSAEESEN